ncbi:MAG: SDR family NAD(P)-dependent oxidoreductase [Planctomycetes bacterium]|nr:SDR family NAD(P)-dependent oxidoreductase [Planctomycetota bacterium]
MKVALEGKTIVITGASSGIGAATARACVAAGMHCVINARRKDKLHLLAKELGENCIVVEGDVTEDGFNQHLLDESGDVYAIFANAGHGLNQSMIDCDMKQCKELFELNVFSAIELASLGAKQMVTNQSGHILLCASCLSKFATPKHGVYSASKSALEAMAKSMRMELKKDKMFVSTVHPIGTRTEFFDVSAVRSGKEESTFSSQSPSWLMQPPEKVANAVVRCLGRPKPEVWTSLPMRLISTSFSAFPKVASTIIQRFS